MSMISELVDRLRAEAKSMGTYGTDYMATLLTRSADTIEMLSEKVREPSNSEIPNNCEHITEDGVTCAKYPACDDCLDNPLNKVKGSERLLKGKDNSTISKMEQVDEPYIDIETGILHWCGWKYKRIYEDEPQTCSVNGRPYDCGNCEYFKCTADEPQTETEIAKAIVHKAIDDAVIAEDAYPNLRQKMHDAVDEYEPQTDCAWK